MDTTLYLAPLTPEWLGQLSKTYGRLTLRELAAEIAALDREKKHAEHFDVATRAQVTELADERMKAALDELRRRATDGRT